MIANDATATRKDERAKEGCSRRTTRVIRESHRVLWTVAYEISFISARELNRSQSIAFTDQDFSRVKLRGRILSKREENFARDQTAIIPRWRDIVWFNNRFNVFILPFLLSARESYRINIKATLVFYVMFLPSRFLWFIPFATRITTRFSREPSSLRSRANYAKLPHCRKYIYASSVHSI